MIRAVACVVVLAGLCAAPAAAQTYTGSAEVNVTSAVTDTASQSTSDTTIGQNYAINWNSFLWDRRLVDYSAGTSFVHNRLDSALTGANTLRSSANDLGYHAGAQVLSASPFPFTFNVLRSHTNSVGNLGAVNLLRGIAVSPTGVPASDFDAVNHEASLGWQLNLPALPHVDLTYRRSSSDMTGGGLSAYQRLGEFSTAVSKSTARQHHSLRYRSSSIENRVNQTYGQKIGNLDYDYGIAFSTRSRLSVTAGRRSSQNHTLFQQVAATPDAPYVAPLTTDSNASGSYAQATYDYAPTQKLSLRSDATVDAQTGGAVTTSSALAGTTVSVAVLPGLRFGVGAQGGRRRQTVADVPLSVLTYDAFANAGYQRDWRRGGIGGSVERRGGMGTAVDGTRGGNGAWAVDGRASTTVQWLRASVGAGRSRWHDTLLDYGNFTNSSLRGSLLGQWHAGSVSFDASTQDLTRGRGLLAFQAHTTSLSTTANYRLSGRYNLAATAGHFVDDHRSLAATGLDRDFYWGLGLDADITGRLRATAWYRSDNAEATVTQYAQDAVSALARLDYRLRQLKFALEYRRSRNLFTYPGVAANSFAGRQVRFSVSRPFGGRL